MADRAEGQNIVFRKGNEYLTLVEEILKSADCWAKEDYEHGLKLS